MKLSPEEKDILSKLNVNQLQLNIELTDKYLPSLLILGNLLLDREKEWFLTDSEPDTIMLAKKHYGLRANILILKKLMRVIKASQHELSRREEVVEKRKNA